MEASETSLSDWLSAARANQNADVDDALVAQAVAWSLDIGSRQVDLYSALVDRMGELRRETNALVYSVTLGAGALLVFSLGQVAEHHELSGWLTWGLGYLGVAAVSSFAARLLSGALAAGVIADIAAVVVEPNWKNRAWAIFALSKGGDTFRKPLAVFVQILFWWGVLFLLSGATLIVVHHFEAARELATAAAQ